MGDEDEEYINDLQHVYRECELSDDGVADAPGIAKTFNRVVEMLHEKYPDNDSIHDVETVDTASQMPRAMTVNTGKVSQMKSEARHLLRELGGEVPEVGVEDSGAAPHVDVDVHQNQSVENAIDINLDAVIKSIDDEHVKDWAEDFREEMEGDDPDESRLRDLYKRIYGLNKAVAASLIAKAITKGIDVVA